MRHSKKGSLELSVNAIIVLVMAIAVLGLGLAFIRGALTRGQEQVFKAIDNAELDNPASADHPAVIDKNVDAKIGVDSQIKMGVYNSATETKTGVEPSLGDCIGTDATGLPVTLAANTDVAMSGGSQDVPGGSARAYQGLIKPLQTANTKPGTYICTVTFTGLDNPPPSAQFTLHVSN